MKRFEKNLPEGYICDMHLDASNKKTGIILSVISLILLVLFIIPYVLCCDWSRFTLDTSGAVCIPFIIALFSYIVLHELTHGAAYKLLTHEKLTFGLSWSCAFCGVPDIYTYRNTAMIALFAPLVLFTIILLPVTIWLYRYDVIVYLVSAFLFSMHLSGCTGDMYVAYLFLTKYKMQMYS